ncbi:hypothetical protein ES703_83847 [subsurface metagenome]
MANSGNADFTPPPAPQQYENSLFLSISTNLKDGINERGSSLRFYDISELLLMALDSPPKTVKESSTEVT